MEHCNLLRGQNSVMGTEMQYRTAWKCIGQATSDDIVFKRYALHQYLMNNLKKRRAKKFALLCIQKMEKSFSKVVCENGKPIPFGIKLNIV